MLEPVSLQKVDFDSARWYSDPKSGSVRGTYGKGAVFRATHAGKASTRIFQVENESKSKEL